MLTEPKEQASTDYYYDIVNIGRQVLGNYFSVLRDRFTTSYEKKDAVALKRNGDAMLELLDDMDQLLSTNRDFLLGKWIGDARKTGVNEKEKNYYEQDARKIITVWGKPGSYLTDYANRSWAGLVKTYYRGRWKMFIDEVELSLKNKTAFNKIAFAKKLKAFEDQWTKGLEKYKSKPVGDCMSVSRLLLKKYAEGIEGGE